jgi:hypothetical protein
MRNVPNIAKEKSRWLLRKQLLGWRLVVFCEASAEGVAGSLHELVALSAAFELTGFESARAIGDVALGDSHQQGLTSRRAWGCHRGRESNTESNVSGRLLQLEFQCESDLRAARQQPTS